MSMRRQVSETAFLTSQHSTIAITCHGAEESDFIRKQEKEMGSKKVFEFMIPPLLKKGLGIQAVLADGGGLPRKVRARGIHLGLKCEIEGGVMSRVIN
jgi:hypothetical protein